LLGLGISPTAGTAAAYDLTPASWIGAVRTGGLAVEVRPKLPIENVLFLVGYALDSRAWRDTPFDFSAGSLTEAILTAFLHHVDRATHAGLLHSYQPCEETLHRVRGAVRFADQLRRHAGRALPAEVRYDDFTADIPENQLL